MLDDSRYIKRKQKKRNKKRKIIISFLFIVIAILAAGLTYASSILNNAEKTVDRSYEDDGRDSGSSLRKDPVEISNDNVSILFIGVDQGGVRSTQDSNGLSDSLILTTFNKEKRSVKMLSIPRDSYVYLPLRDEYTKINHAHSYNGSKGSIITLEHLLDIPIDYYVKVNFDAFIDVIDVLGGIKAKVPYELYEMDSNDTENAIHLLPGRQSLNGEEALALARTRKLDNDIERGKRQQEILQAMFKKALSVNAFLNLNNLITAVGDNMTTNMSFNDMKGLTSYALSSDFNIETLNLEGTDMVTDAYYFELNKPHLEKVIVELKDHLGTSNQNDI